MLRSHWHRAVIHKQTGIDRREFKTARLARSSVGRFGAAARAGDGMEIDVVHHDAVVMIFEAHFDGIANPNADKWPGYLLVEGPVAIGRAIGEVARHLDGLELNFDASRRTAADRRRQVGGIADD